MFERDFPSSRGRRSPSMMWAQIVILVTLLVTYCWKEDCDPCICQSDAWDRLEYSCQPDLLSVCRGADWFNGIIYLTGEQLQNTTMSSGTSVNITRHALSCKAWYNSGITEEGNHYPRIVACQSFGDQGVSIHLTRYSKVIIQKSLVHFVLKQELFSCMERKLTMGIYCTGAIPCLLLCSFAQKLHRLHAR